MQKVKSREGKGALRGRKSGRAAFDKSGKGIWEWQTATDVFERNITEQQLAELENSQLMLLDGAEPKEVVEAISYYDWQAQSKKPAKPSGHPAKIDDCGPIKRLFGRFVRKS